MPLNNLMIVIWEKVIYIYVKKVTEI
jgi:hypothetical protein